jgi:hypothetical protein
MIPPGMASLKVDAPPKRICGYTSSGDGERLRIEVSVSF